MKKKIIIILLIFILNLNLIGCTSSLYIFKTGSGNSVNSIDYSYRLFHGKETKTIKVEKNEKIKIEYDVEVKKGNLEIEVLNKKGEKIWKINLDKDKKGEHELKLKEDTYKLIVRGDKAKGSYNVKYNKM